MKNLLSKKFLFLDIETVGEEKDLETLFKKNSVKANLFNGYIDLISEKFKTKKDNTLYSKYSGLYPEFGKIIVASFGFITPKGELKIESFSGEEKDILEKVKSLLVKVEDLDFWLCGHNIRNFDLPFIVKRMLINGIEPPKILPTINFKPWEMKVVDLKDLWQMGNPQSFSKLDLIACFLGIESSKDGEVNGSSVHSEYWENNNLKNIISYCEKDVSCIINIIEKLKSI